MKKCNSCGTIWHDKISLCTICNKPLEGNYTYICNKCYNLVPADSVICSTCNTAVGTANEKENYTQLCQNCGYKISFEVEFCPKCGHELKIPLPEKNILTPKLPLNPINPVSTSIPTQSPKINLQASMSPTAPPPMTKAHNKSNSKYIISGIIGACVATIAMTLFLNLDFTKNNTSSGQSISKVSNSVKREELIQKQVTLATEKIEKGKKDIKGLRQLQESTMNPKYGSGIHKYKYYVEDCTWYQAFQRAQNKGGYLVRINDLSEYKFILKEISALGYDKIQFFIGGRRDDNDYYYHWVDEENRLFGRPLNSSSSWTIPFWMTGEPSFRDKEIQEKYMNICYYYKENRWVWNDVPNDILAIVPSFSGRIGYIVEYEN